MEHVVFKEKATLIISKELLAQIAYFHNKVKGIEWSGLLFYKVVSGDISEPKTLVLKAERTHLMNIGVSTYTEFSPDSTIMDFYDAYPHCEGIKYGLIHTHHGMETFFSGTDIDELKTNAGAHNFYLSLIVNYREGGQYSAKIALIADVEVETKYKFNNGVSFKGVQADKPVKSTVKRLISIDCDIEYEIDTFDTKRYEELSKKHTPKQSHFKVNSFSEGFEKDNDIYIPKTATEMDSFLSKLLSLDAKENRSMKDVLDQVEADYKKNPDEFENLYLDCVDKAIEEMYFYTFTTALENHHHNQFFRQCIMYLDKYRMSGYSMYDKLIDLFDMYTDIDHTPPVVNNSKNKSGFPGIKQLLMNF